MSYAGARLTGVEAYNTEMSDDESIQESPLLQTGKFQEVIPVGPLEESYVKPSVEPNSASDPWISSEIGVSPSRWGETYAPLAGELSEEDQSDPYFPTKAEQNEKLGFEHHGKGPKIFARKTYQPLEKPRQYEGFDNHSKAEDDALPFEVTKATASQGRQRMSALPRISTGIVMSKENFDTYRRSLDVMRQGSLVRSGSTTQGNPDLDPNQDENDDINPDERERKRQAAKVRQQQEARMSVYRQSMTKLIGEAAPHAPAISSNHCSKSSRDADDLSDDDDIMDDVPLSILQAHGFPKKSSATRKKQDSTPSLLSGPAKLDMVRGPAASTTGARPPSLRPARGLGFSNVFGDTGTRSIDRGLIGEIAKEEEAKRKRQSFPWGAAYGANGDRQSLAHSETMSAPLPGTHASDPTIHDIQAKLQQLIETQALMMQNMNQFPHGQFSTQSAPSLKSRTAHPPMAEPTQASVALPHTISSQPLPAADGDVYHTKAWNRPSTMRLIATKFNESEESDDDDEWREALAARQELRAQWRSQLAA